MQVVYEYTGSCKDIRPAFLCFSVCEIRRVYEFNSLTHSLMELSRFLEAANYAATQELPSILWNPKVHYRVHKSPLLVPILSQIDPIHPILY
jgi:hypothetical protein